MLKLLIATTASLLGFWWINQAPTIKFYAEGLPENIVKNSIARWNLVPQKTDDEFLADVVIKKADLTDLWGIQKGCYIFISKNVELSDNEVEKLISHEFGHFLFVGHNNAKNSIMNDKTELSSRFVTEEDNNQIRFLKLRILICKIMSKLYLISNQVDFN